MALQGAGDPRWVVRERQDGRNVNSWHWEDKDVSGWAKDRIKALLSPSICIASDDDAAVAVQSVDSVDGDATLYNRKGVLKVLYDLKVAGKWATSHAEEDARTKGDFKFELFDEEPAVVASVDAESRAEHRYKVLFMDQVGPLIRSQCQVFIREMHAGAGQSLDGLTVPVKEKSAETAAGDFPRSGVERKGKTVSKKTTVLELRDVFTCSAADMYQALTERAQLEAITRSKAVSEAKVGGRFDVLNGTVRGTYVGLVPEKEVRMAWKLRAWGEEAGEGSVVVRIFDEDGKTGLEVRIEGVPDGQASSTEGFWRVQIFQAMKVVMGWGSAFQFLR